MKRNLLLFLFAIASLYSLCQGRPGKGQMPSGRVYGKVVDDQKKPVEYAIIKVLQSQSNSEGLPEEKLIQGALTASNGDFSVDKIPIGTPLIISIELIGFETLRLNFQLNTSGFPVEKDLGNIVLNAGELKPAVVIEGERPSVRLEFDRRVFDVEKNPMNAGGTGEDVLRNIPSVQVDIDGNVSLRNAAPQIFVDGRPTTLTIDQIPADAIQRVELITNPGSKYDASGGGGGIINIIMKHNRSNGYNGSIRAGIDKRGRANGGGDFSFREGKFNFFVNGNFNRRKNLTNGETERLDLTSQPNTLLLQEQNTNNQGYFGNGRFGVDWFWDNRNTLTFTPSVTLGQFNPLDNLETTTDSSSNFNDFPLSFYYRTSETKRQFQNYGTSLQYKHLFTKEGTELTADINTNAISSEFIGDYGNYYDNGFTSIQRQTGSARQQLYTAQTDFVSRLSENHKFEAGLRGSFRDFESKYQNKSLVNDEYVVIQGLNVNYHFIDQVYAAYSNISHDGEKWKTQLGLRLESSDYRGELLDTNVNFRNSFPLSLFPSAYITRVINEKQDIQIAFNRRINRPGFMQLVPFTDYSDSLNVSRGNPSLRPEFTYNTEVSYQYTISPKSVFIGALYYRITTNSTVRYLFNEFSPVLNDEIVVSTYANADFSSASGLELVFKTNLLKWLEMTANFNFYNSTIDGSNITENLTNSVNTFWLKSNFIAKLPKNYTAQANFDYTSRRALDVGSGERAGNMGGGGGGGFGGGGGGWGGTNNTVQGFIEPIYGLDLSLRKDFLKNKNLSVTISMSDVLRSRVTRTHAESAFFIQDSFRRRDPQLWRLQLSWKFGKMDATLFKRKNMRSNSDSMEG